MKGNPKLKVMVSSTVYGFEELLDRVFTLLTACGYEVWMSHKGTLPVYSDRNAFDNCLAAVEKCDLFLGLITPNYGSGQDRNDPVGLSITHREILRAIELKKPRWLLAHDHVVLARRLLMDLEIAGASPFRDVNTRAQMSIKAKSSVIDNLKVIKLYEDAILAEITDLSEREGNWVQQFRNNEDASRFVFAQFSRYQEVEEFIKENFDNPDSFGGKK